MRNRWEGEADQEIGKDVATGKVIVRVDPRYYRPTEVELLVCPFILIITDCFRCSWVIRPRRKR
jgi:hypothetical protein